MQIFLNERSFCEQCHDFAGFRVVMTRLIGLVELVRRTLGRRQGRLWRSEHLGDARALPGETLRRSLNHVAGRELKESFTDVVFNKANPAPWEPERQHHSDVGYFCRIDALTGEAEAELGPGERVTDSSMAELAERKLVNVDLLGCLLNLRGSPLDGRPLVSILKQGCEPMALPSVCTEAEFESWLRQVGDLSQYSLDATTPPRDEQTCLVDRRLYAPTGSTEQGRQVYRHLTRNDYIYVDNLHVGSGAHLEVFDKRGRHRGEASLQGELDPKKRDASKFIKV